MKATIKNGILQLEIPVNPTPVPSASGKSRVVASTRGNVQLADLQVEGKPVTIGLNAYIGN